jgi:site-specific recombinase XerD
MKDFSQLIVEQFRDELSGSCEGEGAKSYYGRFRKMVRHATKMNLLVKNPCEFVNPPRGEAKTKDVLTVEELQKVAKTATNAPEVKRAFLFCTQTGLRFCDVKALQWSNINFSEREIRIKQTKTGKTVVIPLNKTAIGLLQSEKPKEGLVFDLPTANGCNKSLQSLVDKAEIEKKISWHCARHGYGTNLVFHGADIYTTSQLLGHASLTHTKRYLRASREMNQKAVDNLPTINL